MVTQPEKQINAETEKHHGQPFASCQKVTRIVGN